MYFGIQIYVVLRLMAMYNYDVSRELQLQNLKFCISLQASIEKGGSLPKGEDKLINSVQHRSMTGQEAFHDL